MEIEILKQKMKDYRDFFGGELNRKDLIDEAENTIDLHDILNMHFDYIKDMTSDAKDNLDRFKRELGLF